MNFNYRDFFIHNDDLHIIKEQLSINDAWVIKQDALSTNAKAVWDMYQTENNEQEIAKTLGINVDTVKKIIAICEKKFLENKTIKQIADEMNFNKDTIHAILNKAIPDWERYFDANFTKDAEEIYNLHKEGKSPEEIVKLINQNRKSYLQIKLDKVNLVLKIVDIATKQMENDGITNSLEIERQINGAKNDMAIVRLIKKLGIGKIRYTHKFTPEQDAFILSNYLQRICQSESARQFNTKFSTDSNKLNIDPSPIRRHLIKTILKSKSESEISEYALNLIRDYKTEYFSTVNIEDPKTKELLKNYTPPEKIKGKDKTGTGTNRDMSAHLGTVQTNFNTMVTNLRNAHTIR
jgi:DNA-binding CsgD family transcriptional regulator